MPFGCRPTVLIVLALGLISWPARPLAAQEWTRFRGPNGTGGSESEAVPILWKDADYEFKTTLPGIGHSSPVIWGERVFLTSAFEDSATRLIICLHAHSGEILWQKQYTSEFHDKHLRNSFASSTPAVDAQHVYVVWSTPSEYSVVALDHQGEKVWTRNLGPYVSQHSCGTSPIVYEDLVVLGNDQDGDSFLIALDAATGETRWQTPRTPENVAYSTPCVRARLGRPDELIFNSGAHGITAVNPHDGHVIWELDVLDKRSVSSPIMAAGLIFGSTGSGGGGNYVVALRPGEPVPAAGGGAAKGDSQIAATGPEIAYRIDESAPYVPTLIAHRDLVFLWSDKGTVACIRAATGEGLWLERVGGNFSGSPIRIRDRLVCIAEDGTVVVLAASEKYELLGKIPLGEDSRATPAVAEGRLYLRTNSQLFAVRPLR